MFRHHLSTSPVYSRLMIRFDSEVDLFYRIFYVTEKMDTVKGQNKAERVLREEQDRTG